MINDIKDLRECMKWLSLCVNVNRSLYPDIWSNNISGVSVKSSFKNE